MLNNKRVEEKIILNSIINDLKSKYRLEFKTKIEDKFQYIVKYVPTPIYTNYFSCVSKVIKIGEDVFSIFYLTIILDSYNKLIFGSNIFEIDKQKKFGNTLYTEQNVYEIIIKSLTEKKLKYAE